MKPWGFFLVSQDTENPFQVLRLLLTKFKEGMPLLILLVGRSVGVQGAATHWRLARKTISITVQKHSMWFGAPV